MSEIDRSRIAAQELLISMGYRFIDGTWCELSPRPSLAPAADAMHAVLIQRLNILAGYTESSAEEAELYAIADVIEDYEAVRWPSGFLRGESVG